MKLPLQFPSGCLLLGLVYLFMQTVSANAQAVLAVNEIRVISTTGIVAAKSADGKTITITLANVKDGEVPIAAKQGPGSTLAAGASSSAFISIPSTGSFKMEADTQVKLPQADEKGHTLELLKGRLFMNIDAEELKKRGNATFRLKTPAALLAVKGTKFFAVSAGATDTIGVHQGSVEVSEPVSKQTLVLNSGRAVDVSKGLLGKERSLTKEESISEKFYGMNVPKTGFTNSLGMKFVPVADTSVLFCVHETRYKDYAAYAAETQGVDASWKNQTIDGYTPADRPADHPVINVSWEDAQKFCAWLSQKEGRKYRLPTDHEWSYAAGIEHYESWKNDGTPYLRGISSRQLRQRWGFKMPPPKGSGNYSDESHRAKITSTKDSFIERYDDGFPTTAPVMSFQPDKFGLYDLSGNVWEFCEDWYDHNNNLRVLRGESWKDGSWKVGDTFLIGGLSLTNRQPAKPDARDSDQGFRCVVEIDQ